MLACVSALARSLPVCDLILDVFCRAASLSTEHEKAASVSFPSSVCLMGLLMIESEGLGEMALRSECVLVFQRRGARRFP